MTELPGLMSQCQGMVIFPGLEDFGIVHRYKLKPPAVPSSRIGAGGALDTVIPGVTGEHCTQK